jgi:hypothetical protein
MSTSTHGDHHRDDPSGNVKANFKGNSNGNNPGRFRANQPGTHTLAVRVTQPHGSRSRACSMPSLTC